MVFCSGNAAQAAPTRSFVLDSQTSLSEGKLDGTAIESDGTIRAGVQTRRTELPGVPTAKSLLTLPDGTAYVGTGNDGKIYAVKDGVAKLFAETKQVMVTSLARDASGTLYAGTLPGGKIFAINSQGNVRELVALPGAEHVWALVFDDASKTLYAATGPEGKLFAIASNGKADVYYDSEDAHIMALARADDGQLYLGTSDRALLVRLRGPGRAEVLFDFEGSEVTALALRGKQVAVLSNQFPKSLKPSKPSAPPSAAQAGVNNGAATPAPSTPPAAPAAGKGQLFHVSASGEVEQLYSADEGHLTSVAWADDDVIYLGTGKEGHMRRVRVSDREHALLLDVDERQILAIQLAGPTPTFVTADGGAVYTINAGAGKREWTSKALDAGTRARFGSLYARTRGAVSISTRSGNTDKPDLSWSDWSAPLAAAGPVNPSIAAGAVQSPPARFLQVRVALSQADSVVYALEAFYLQDNRAPVITEVTVEPPRAASADKSKPGQSSAGSQYKLHWKVENLDNESLRYRVSVRRENAQQYRALLRDSDVLTATDYTWETEAAPDGYYRSRIEASDELDNPAALARRARAESEPFLVDNRAPELVDLRVQGARVVGRAFDEQGPISRLEYSLDGFEWRVLKADDDLLDAREEPFSLPLSQLPKGVHLLAVRASDARNNTVTRELELSIP
jgi:outer membrane protein assembly factor BamB